MHGSNKNIFSLNLIRYAILQLQALLYNLQIVLFIIAVLFNLFPFCLVGLILSIVQVPFYLVVRANLKEPIHAIGLNNCFVVTLLFFILLDICIKVMLDLIVLPLVVVFTFLSTKLMPGVFITSS